MEILTIHFFVTGNSVKEVAYEDASLALCTTDSCGIALLVELERLPTDVQKGDEFIWIWNKECPHFLERLEITHVDCCN